MSATCPCCGGEVAPLDVMIDEAGRRLARRDVTMHVSPAELAIVDKLLQERPASVTRAELRAAYSRDAARPGEKSTVVLVSNLRRRLATLGLAIVNRGEGYRIEECEPVAAPRLEAHQVECAIDMKRRGFPTQSIASTMGVPHRIVAAALTGAAR